MGTTSDTGTARGGAAPPRGAAAFQRARSPEHKLERREAILAAARQLALRDGVRAVSLGDIAAAVGIHKSALLRYFETREQLFLELAAREWREWSAALVDSLAGVSGSAAVIDGAAVADAVAESFGERPLLCDLIPHTALNLERNSSVAAVREYKLVSLGSVGAIAEAVRRALPTLSEDDSREFVSTVTSLAGATWQIANPPPALAELYRTDPELARACYELVPRLRRTGTVILAGLGAV
jgi:AcrR family transcriptional regulator